MRIRENTLVILDYGTRHASRHPRRNNLFSLPIVQDRCLVYHKRVLASKPSLKLSRTQVVK